MPVRARSRDCRSDYGGCFEDSLLSYNDGDSSAYSFRLPRLHHTSSYFDRSTFGPGCGDYGCGGRMNLTIHDPEALSKMSTTPLFRGETSVGYGIDCITPPTVHKKRASRIREFVVEMLLRSRSRRREKKELSIAATAQRKQREVSPRACSLTLPPRRSRSPLKNNCMVPAIHRTPTYRPGFEGYERHYIDEICCARKPTISWMDDRRRRRRRSSRERYLRTPSADTVLLDSPPSKREGRVRWASGEELRMMRREEPRRKKKKEEKERMRVRTYEGATPQRVQFATVEEKEGGGRRRMKNAFVNSHEWTLSRQVSEMHLGIIGSTSSGKNALVHRYLTSIYQPDESPEGGRFKKEVVVDNQSHLLLIRDEGAAEPEAQITLWADAIIFVYSVDRWDTFQDLELFYELMSKYRSLKEMPVILVGTKDTVSEQSPRVVTEEQGKRLAMRFGRCSYFETNAAYGSNVERVFKEVCQKMFASRRHSIGASSGRTPTPTDKYDKYAAEQQQRVAAAYGQSQFKAAPYMPPGYHQRSVSAVPGPDHPLLTASSTAAIMRAAESGGSVSARKNHAYSARGIAAASAFGSVPSASFASRASQLDPRGISPSSSQKSIASNISNGAYSRSSAALLESNGSSSSVIGMYHVGGAQMGGAEASVSTSHLHTPSSTPTAQRKNRRISNIFRPKEHHEDKAARASHEVNMGVGRAIPIMQGQLYKRSGGKSALNRSDWKKKFVTLTNDGKLTYHVSLKDYMENVQGKEVFLGLAAVRMPGKQRTRNSQAVSTVSLGGAAAAAAAASESNEGEPGPVASGEGTSGGGSDDGVTATPSSCIPVTPQTVATTKKRRGTTRRQGKGGADEDEECFEIITCDQKRWEFCASSVEEREQWVKAIEGQIDAALQKQLSQPSNQQRVLGAKAEVAAMVELAGNGRCADCSAARPEWASLNLGTLICMECSGVHRNLGSHLSRVRSLKFDDWPVEFLAVMRAIGGNAVANSIWEARMPQDQKPKSDASPDVREAFIRAKYVTKKFLAPLADGATPVSTQLIGAVLSGDVHNMCALLARATTAEVNAHLSKTDRRTVLHLACAHGNVQVVQLLLWNNADLRATDDAGRSALWYARDSKECTSVLLAAGLPADFGMFAPPHPPHGTGAASTVAQQPPPLPAKPSAVANGTDSKEHHHNHALGDSQLIMGSLSTRDYTDSTRRQLSSIGGNA